MTRDLRYSESNEGLFYKLFTFLYLYPSDFLEFLGGIEIFFMGRI